MALSPQQTLALALDPSLLFELQGLKPDPWQRELLRSTAPRILLNCCRQAGKSTAAAALALHTALFTPGSLVLLLSRVQRQSSELFRKVMEFYQAVESQVGEVARSTARSTEHLELTNGSRIVALPGHEESIRSYSGVRLLVIDEAARVREDLYRAVRPMLAVSGGRLMLLSTPFGRRGFFYQAWGDQVTDWLRFEVRADKVPRITRAFLEAELRDLGRSWFNQEYACSFETREGLVYPEFSQCLVRELPEELRDIAAQCADESNGKQGFLRRYLALLPFARCPRLVGGIDWGFRDPFAAVWGALDRHDVLWIFGEHYQRRAPLNRLAAQLSRSVDWYADPSRPTEIAEFHCGGFVIHKGINPVEAGIAAVTARIQTDRLKVLADRCPHLLAEAQLYRYRSKSEQRADKELPIDKDNHGPDALRYLIAGVDRRFMVQARRSAGAGQPASDATRGAEHAAASKQRKWLSIYNEALWTPLNY